MNELKIKQAQQKSLRRAKSEVARLVDELNAARFWHDVAEVGIIEPIEQVKSKVRRRLKYAIIIVSIAVIVMIVLSGCNAIDGFRTDIHQWTETPEHHREK